MKYTHSVHANTYCMNYINVYKREIVAFPSDVVELQAVEVKKLKPPQKRKKNNAVKYMMSPQPLTQCDAAKYDATAPPNLVQ